MRLFVALELPARTRDALAARTVAWVAAGQVRLRPVAATDLHVTLCFLADQPASAIAPITDALRAAVAGIAPVRLTLGESLWLPRRRPRVLAVRLSAEAPADREGPPRTDGLNLLQARVAAALVVGGWYAAERRPFLAHVTVARMRGGVARMSGGGLRFGGADGPEAPGRRDTTDGPQRPGGCGPALNVPEGRFEAGEVALIRSRLGAGPVRYERLAVCAPAPPG